MNMLKMNRNMDSTVLFMSAVKKAWRTVKRKYHKVTIDEYE